MAQPRRGERRRFRWPWFGAFLCYTVALWVGPGPLWAVFGVLVGVGLIGLGAVQHRRRNQRADQ